MKYRQTRTVGGVSALALLTTLGAGTAQALDLKTFPGSFCQASGSQQSLYYGGSKGMAIANRTLVARSAVCPIVRDNTNQPMLGLRVTVRDRHPLQGVRCVSHSTPANAIGGWSSTQGTGGAFQGFDTLSFGALPQAPGGVYSVVCQLPGMVANVPSYLTSYQLVEP